VAPVLYDTAFLPDADTAFALLRDELAWERRDDAPRCEYYCNVIDRPYTYGQGRGRRTYQPHPWHPMITAIGEMLVKRTGVPFEACFLNRYLDQSDHLGWHADDSPEMDDARPIAIVSLGVPREIWFRRKEEPSVVEKLLLGHGTLCLMAPGMQDTWQHRIPKASFTCGERISLTFRGYV